MNPVLQQSSSMMVEGVEDIIKLKVQVTKCQLQLQSYKQMEKAYQQLLIKSDFVEKKLVQYEQIMQVLSEKVKQIMALLKINYCSLLGNSNSQSSLFNKNYPCSALINGDSYNKLPKYNQSNGSNGFLNFHLPFASKNKLHKQVNGNFLANPFTNPSNLKSQSLYNSRPLSPQIFKKISPSFLLGRDNSALKRKVKRLSSMKSQSNQYGSDSSIYIEFGQQELKLQLVDQSIRLLLKQVQQYRTTLEKYQKSSKNIQMNTKQQQKIFNQLEETLLIKEKQIKQKDQEIHKQIKQIEILKSSLSLKSNLIDKQEGQQTNLIHNYESLQNAINELHQVNNQQEINKNTLRNNCHQLVQELALDDEASLKKYLKQNLAQKYPLYNDNQALYSNRSSNLQFDHSQKEWQRFSETGFKPKFPLNYNKKKYSLIFQ